MIANAKLLLWAIAVDSIVFVIFLLVRYRDEIGEYFRRRKASAPVETNLGNGENDESFVRDAKKLNYKIVEKYEEKQKLAHTTFRDFVDDLKKDYPEFPAEPTQRMDVYVRLAKREGSIGGGISGEGMLVAVKEAYQIIKADEKIVKDEIDSLFKKSKFFKKSSKLGDMQLYTLRK